jgi:repressor of nif and glnA expression
MSPKVTFQQVAENLSGISKVGVVIHTMDPVSPNTSNNHWSIYLLLREGGGSIRVNMRAISDSDNRELIEYERQEAQKRTRKLGAQVNSRIGAFGF